MDRELVFAAFVVLAGGCVSADPVLMKNNSVYDGDYLASMHDTAPLQEVAGLGLQCEQQAHSLFIRIRQGVASGYLLQNENYSFRTAVKSGGDIRAVMPVDSFYPYRPDSALPQSAITLILNASLAPDALNGKFVVGDRRFDYQGCATNVELIAL